MRDQVGRLVTIWDSFELQVHSFCQDKVIFRAIVRLELYSPKPPIVNLLQTGAQALQRYNFVKTS